MAAAHSHVRSQVTWIALMDLFCLFLGGFIGVAARFGPEELGDQVFSHIDGWMILFSSVLVANYLAGDYRLRHAFSRFNLVVTWLFSLTFAILILSITSYAWFRILLGRGVLFLSLAGYSLLSLFLKLFVYKTLFQSELFQCRAVILGTGDRARELRRLLESAWVLPSHKVIAYLQPNRDEGERGGRVTLDDGVAVVETRDASFVELVKSLGADLLVIGFDRPTEARSLYPQLRRLRFEGIEVFTGLSAVEVYAGRTPLSLVTEDYITQASLESGLPTIRQLKRLVDLIVGIVALIFFLPLMLVIAAVIKILEPRAPVFYAQERAGQFGVPFRMWKFRSMVVGAESVSGPVWSPEEDPRVTRVGRFLRRFRLDELPQFFNVIRGDMSLVGPRPERPELIEALEREIPFYSERQNVMPGLTGWAQIRYPYGNTVDDARKKLEFDLYYIKHLSLALDLQIVLSTLQIVVVGQGGGVKSC